MVAGLSMEAELLWTVRDMFYYPERDNLADIQTGLNRLVQWTIETGRNDLRDYKPAPAVNGIDLKQLQVDFTALFVNAFPVVKAHPFAGWYEGDGIMMGPSDTRVREFYFNHGVECSTMQLPADHITAELEFLALMAEKYHDTANFYFYQAMRDMVQQHMKHWVPMFLRNVLENAQTDFYRSLASALMIIFQELTVQLGEVA